MTTEPRHLPRLCSRDLVAEIARKRRAVLRRQIRNRCLGTGSCDCPLCSGR